MLAIKSAIPGIAWPAVPAPGGAAIFAALFQLERSQWWSPAEHWARQREQLAQLLRHAVETCPYFGRTIGPAVPAVLQDSSAEAFRSLPVVRRADLQDHHPEITSRRLPQGHGRTHAAATSGSTGEPVRYLTTELSSFFWQAFNLRDHFWHRRDFSLKLAAIRFGAKSEAMRNWFGEVGETTIETGPCVLISMSLPIAEQARRVVEENPAYLTGYPNNLRGVLEHIEQTGSTLPALKQIRTFGEALTDELRRYVGERWKVPLIDLYSTREAGYLALQCPDAEDVYHVQSESVYLEVLDHDGRPCKPGETGRVVVTPLHNFAFPLIRYELGDFAEVGGPCRCGRGLPVIRRIRGRSRNLMKLRDGRTFWPVFGAHALPDIAPVRQFQFVQTGYDELEVRLVVYRDLTDSELQSLRSHILSNVGHPFRVRWTFLPEIPYDRGGKFEDFIRAFDD